MAFTTGPFQVDGRPLGTNPLSPGKRANRTSGMVPKPLVR